MSKYSWTWYDDKTQMILHGNDAVAEVRMGEKFNGFNEYHGFVNGAKVAYATRREQVMAHCEKVLDTLTLPELPPPVRPMNRGDVGAVLSMTAGILVACYAFLLLAGSL